LLHVRDRTLKTRACPASVRHHPDGPVLLYYRNNKSQSGKKPMLITRRHAVAALAAPAILSFTRGARAATKTLKISHQFPASDGTTGDFRDQICRKFAADVEKQSNGELKFEIYPNSSLMKTFAQFNAMKKGALDFSLFPTTYAGGEIPELNLTFMPAIVSSYEQGYKWKTAPIGQAMTKLLEDKGIKIITWVWQSGGIASKTRAIIKPADAAGLKIRGGSREMDMMFKAAGATTANMPSNEIYIAMQTGAVDAAVTSSTSLLSFKLEELSKYLTSAGGQSFFFVFEPLLMSKQIFDGLPAEQQKIILKVGEDLEPFGLQGSKADDKALSEVYAKANVKVNEMDSDSLAQWRKVASDSAWKDFAARSSDTAHFLQMAESV
jgi:TRAP-type C4-dicarboxylate transport system substrate-binding protein